MSGSKNFLSALSVALMVAATGGQAQNIAQATPAELPPASYGADQYVDSRGCVFIRAGSGGVVNWVPRVTRSRKQLCGYQPSLASAQSTAPAPAVAAPVATAPRPVTGVATGGRATYPHVQENRRNTVVQNVPEGYRPVWEDGRLNPNRATWNVGAARRNVSPVPEGYKAGWGDGRLNLRRGKVTATGDAQSSAIWTDTVPRRLVGKEQQPLVFNEGRN